jgi:cytochrome c553
MKTTPIILTLSALVVLAGCGQKEQPAAQTPDTMAPAAPASSAPAADPVAEAGKIKYGSVCAGCHGLQAQGQASFPKLAGQSAEQLAGKLHDYKAGKTLGQQSAMMIPNAQSLSDEDINALAKYIASLPN